MKRVLRLYTILCLLPLELLAAPANSSLEFVENKGQWKEPFLYKCLTGSADIYLEKNGFTYLLGASDNFNKVHGLKEGQLKVPQILKFHAYKVMFENALQAEVVGSKAQQHYYNYFIGNDPNRWKSGIHPYYNVDYKHLYNGIDLHLSSDEGRLKYDLIVAAGANPNVIKMNYAGTDGLEVSNGNLLIKTSVGTVQELKPYAYQYVNGERREVNCKYKITGSSVSFIFPWGYDTKEVLVIDPVTVFASYTGSTADNWGFTATYDNAGNFYAGGASSGAGYPTTTGAYDITYNGGGTCGGNNGFPSDITISKFNPAGTALIFSTYLGGASESDQPHSMIVDQNGNLVLAGRTCSNDYPTTGGAFRTSNSGGSDIVVTSINSAGTALVGSTYIGGSQDDGMNISGSWGVFNTSLKHSYGDDARSEVIVDAANNIYVAGCTQSANFPTASPYQGSNQGAQDAVVCKFNPTLTNLLWGTYIGGTNNDAAYVLAFNKTQTSIYVSGGTASSGFPSTGGTWQPGYGGGIADGFILKFQNGGGYGLQRGTFLGGSNYDQSYGIQTDAKGAVYAMGQTLANGIGTFNASYSNANSSQFVIKLDSNLSTRVYSTQFGSGNSAAVNITPTAFLVDTCENVYISGWGGGLAGSGGSTTGMPVNLGSPIPALITSTTTGEDFYFIVLQKDATALLFGGFYGSTTIGDHVDGGTSRFDKNGVIYQALCGGCGGSSSVPTTTGAYKTANGSSNCNLVAFKMELNLGNVNANFSVAPAKVCLGQSVSFSNISVNATSYEWDFGDGSGTFTGVTPPPKIYTSVGTFFVRLIAINFGACNARDTMIVPVIVDDNSIDAVFNADIIDTCAPYSLKITNISKEGKTPAGTVYTWYYGDGSSVTGKNPPNKNYSTAGTYTITLVMADPTACNTPDSFTRTVTFKNDLVKAAFIPGEACIADSFRVTNQTTNGVSYKWDFGDGNTSTQVEPGHKYNNIGFYTIKLWAYNSATCNKVDSTSLTIEVRPSPTASFTYLPLVPITNEPYSFTNTSQNAALYNWNFGDGTGSQENNPSHFYKRTGEYIVCLIASNKEGCTDTICKPILADVRPLADIPNAFSPNGDGKNDILYVRGAAIQTVNLKIYNRWGQMVFETNDMNIGWDGTYKGKPQEMEAYAYVLHVTFVDETTFYKRGNISLLR